MNGHMCNTGEFAQMLQALDWLRGSMIALGISLLKTISQHAAVWVSCWVHDLSLQCRQVHIVYVYSLIT